MHVDCRDIWLWQSNVKQFEIFFVGEAPATNDSKKSKMSNKGEKNPNAVLKYIQDKYIKMDGNDVKQSNVIIEKFIRPVLMKAMCDSDDLFKVLYSVSL